MDQARGKEALGEGSQTFGVKGCVALLSPMCISASLEGLSVAHLFMYLLFSEAK